MTAVNKPGLAKWVRLGRPDDLIMTMEHLHPPFRKIMMRGYTRRKGSA